MLETILPRINSNLEDIIDTNGKLIQIREGHIETLTGAIRSLVSFNKTSSNLKIASKPVGQNAKKVGNSI